MHCHVVLRLSAMDGNSSFEIVAAFVADSYIDQGILLTYLSGIVFRIYDILCMYVNVYVYIYICTYVYFYIPCPIIPRIRQFQETPNRTEKSVASPCPGIPRSSLDSNGVQGIVPWNVLLVLFNPWIPSGKLA